MDKNGVDAIREKLASFETMTWREILLDAKKQNHNISVDDLVKEAQDRLFEIFPELLDELASLRLTGNGRVWGKIDEGVMDLLWWDAEYRVCPSHKKHT
jgi:ABC-type branched-subunit amino acid transport system ATPase component